ncbi:DNA polymerase [Sesamum angolense]|uniref:DNA-directed DNA polymerase n=1 Tax=Sesamum angolense TaxID=2727404 RepID=A0AAE1T5N3_9LAMI|nr:DNA polymerase [Sesamum angolense]
MVNNVHVPYAAGCLLVKPGSKGSIQHENLVVSDLQVNSENLINYLRQDILILGGVMLKAQEINWSKYQIDVEDVMTITSLSLKIFRKLYFDDNAFHINIPTRNQDTFIRRGYYGGHVDVYKPHGENLYYYDVNSLYPYIMKSYPMPSGDPVWKNNLESVELDSLFGFIEAYVVTRLFGYMFEKKSSPFEGFISDLYESRLEAKKRESIVTEICNQEKYDEMMMKDNFQSADKLNDDYYIVNYISNSQIVDDTEWKAPKHSAVQLSAAITACARIHMYPHISREDCYYTDTDSIVLGSPLSDDLVSSKEMGKFKLENHVKKGIFLAPKSYMLEIEDDQHIIKHKGPAKDLVTSEWFQKVLEDPSLTEKIATSANFRIDWKELKIVKKDILLKLGLPQSNKRENIYDSNNLWIDTRPLDIIDLGTKDATTIFKYELLTKNGEIDKNHLSNEKITKLLEEMDDENKSLLSKYYEEEGNQSTNEGQKTTTVQPTLYNNKPKKNKKSKDNDTTKIYRPKPDE